MNRLFKILLHCFIIKNQRGISFIGVLFVLLVISGIGYTLTEMMISKQESIPNRIHSEKAFYIAEAGIQYADTYLLRLADWNAASNTTKSLGGGSFSITYSDYSSGATESIKAGSSGIFATATRVVEKTYER